MGMEACIAAVVFAEAADERSERGRFADAGAFAERCAAGAAHPHQPMATHRSRRWSACQPPTMGRKHPQLRGLTTAQLVGYQP